MGRYLFILFKSAIFIGYVSCVCDNEMNDITAACSLTCAYEKCSPCESREEPEEEMYTADSEEESFKESNIPISLLIIGVMIVCVTVISFTITVRVRLLRRKDEKLMMDAHFDQSTDSKRTEANGVAAEEFGDIDQEPLLQNTAVSDTKRSIQNPLKPEDAQSKECSVGNGGIREDSVSKIYDDAQERVMCKICLNRKMSVVFAPCNHMVACSSCSDRLDHCAVCRTVIKGTFIVYTQF